MNRAFCIFLFCSFIFSCSSTNSNDPYVKELTWLNSASPDRDAPQAIKKGDFRFKGMNNHGLVVVPGVDELAKCLNWKTDVDVIGGNDIFLTYEARKLDKIAYLYADYYNAYILYYWHENYKSKLQCNQ